MVNAGDYAKIKVEPRGKELTFITYDPSGNKVRGAKLGPEEDNFDFVVDRAGNYRLDNAIAGSYAITLEKIVSLAARLAPLKPGYESPRINALRAAVETGDLGSVGAFWQRVEKEGGPIIEPLPRDDKNMLVTFLWKGTPDTHNVFVARLPYAGGAPEDYLMDHLGGRRLVQSSRN